MKATADFWDDQDDVYAVYLRRGDALRLARAGAPGGRCSRSGARRRCRSPTSPGKDLRVRLSDRPDRRERLA